MSQSDTVTVEQEHGHPHRDDVGAKMGMWIFLLTEVLLFGGIFLAYANYRFLYPEYFRLSALELNTGLGTLNTIILLTSSLTVVLAIVALKRNSVKLALFYLGTTLGFATIFLIIKYFEWMTKIHHGLYPGSEVLLSKPNGQIVFFGLYFAMTGLHALHVIIGMILLAFMFVFIYKGSVNKDNFVKLENAGLYWHLVDLIWIFLFPLFYLIQ